MICLRVILSRNLSSNAKLLQQKNNGQSFSTAICLCSDSDEKFEQVKLDYFKDVTIPLKGQKLKQVPKVPFYAAHQKPPHLQRLNYYITGEEQAFNYLRYGQYGIISEEGGNMLYGHFESIRSIVNKYIDPSYMFATWSVDPPWKPCYKWPVGKTLGGGKPKINHYSTPVKAKRIILEIGGKCEFQEVWNFLRTVPRILPFKAKVVSQQILESDAKKEKLLDDLNYNKYNYNFVIRNNMGGNFLWQKKTDYFHFGKFPPVPLEYKNNK